ncbi:MAG: MCE family protein [Bacteroidaceae bacterium]|nr:MCE family protein [Bacteroidaceae bacterium]
MKREIKIGLTGIIALVILFYGIKFLKGIQLFDRSQTYYIVFKNAKGLTKSSTVFADGYNIGIVSDVAYERPGRVVVEINVNSGVKIPHGTKALLDEGMLGGCTLNMIMGCNPADCYIAGDSIIGSDANGLMASVADVMPKVEAVMAHVDSLIQTLNKLASDPNLALILKNAEQLTANLDHSTQQLNHLLDKEIPQMAQTFTKAGDNAVVLTENLAQLDLQKTLDKVDVAMDQVQNATLKLNSTDNNLGLLLNDASLYSNLTGTLNSATNLLEDLKAHPKRYINVSVFGGKNKDKE